MPSITTKSLALVLASVALADTDIKLNNEARDAADLSISIPSITIPSITIGSLPTSFSGTDNVGGGTTISLGGGGTTISHAGATFTGGSSLPQYTCSGSILCAIDQSHPDSCVCCVGDPGHNQISGNGTSCSAGTAEPLTSFESGGSTSMASTTSSGSAMSTSASTITTTNSAGSTITSTTASAASVTTSSTSTHAGVANHLAPGMLRAGVLFAAMAL